MKDIPVYRFPAEHARENGELELYRASNKANTACKEAIEKAISEHYCDNVLHREAVAQVAEQFGHERILYVLAIRFLYKGIIIKHNKTEPTYTKTSLFLCEKRRFFMARTEKGVVTTI